MVPAVDPGFGLHVRENRSADLEAVPARRVLLYVRSAADPSEAAAMDAGAAAHFGKLVNVP
jgi:hypothetical protein